MSEKSNKIITFSGRLFEVSKVREDDIDIVDISYGLSNIARFAGQVPFYSVAKHSIYVAKSLPEDLRLTGLLHDASEAYIGDIISPIKHLMKGYLEIEEMLMGVISKKWGLSMEDRRIREADRKALEHEKSILFFNKGYRTENQKEIIDEFMGMFNEITRGS